MTGDGTYTYTYDAWNRLTEADLGENVVAVYNYDGVNPASLNGELRRASRRVSKAVAVRDACGTLTGYDRTDYEYDEAWISASSIEPQVLEERLAANACSAEAVATAPHAQYVWDLRYIDAPVLRIRDTAGPSCGEPDGDLGDAGDEVLYYTTDANMNVTALVNPEGEVVERYAYEAYGAPTVLNGVEDAAGNDTSESEWDQRTTDTFANEILFAGYRYNYETGNSQVRNREYSPTLGRWVQPDPAGYVEGANLYEYVANGPTLFRDWSGLASTCSAPADTLLKSETFNMVVRLAGLHGKGEVTLKCTVDVLLSADETKIGVLVTVTRPPDEATRVAWNAMAESLQADWHDPSSIDDKRNNKTRTGYWWPNLKQIFDRGSDAVEVSFGESSVQSWVGIGPVLNGLRQDAARTKTPVWTTISQQGKADLRVYHLDFKFFGSKAWAYSRVGWKLTQGKYEVTISHLTDLALPLDTLATYDHDIQELSHDFEDPRTWLALVDKRIALIEKGTIDHERQHIADLREYRNALAAKLPRSATLPTSMPSQR